MSSRRERLAAERAAERAEQRRTDRLTWPTLRLPVWPAVKAALAAAVALALLTEEAHSTALGAGLAALVWLVLAIGEQVLGWSGATARGTSPPPAYGLSVHPTIGGKVPSVPRQRL